MGAQHKVGHKQALPAEVPVVWGRAKDSQQTPRQPDGRIGTRRVAGEEGLWEKEDLRCIRKKGQEGVLRGEARVKE